jgi:hypothetical protein
MGVTRGRDAEKRKNGKMGMPPDFSGPREGVARGRGAKKRRGRGRGRVAGLSVRENASPLTAQFKNGTPLFFSNDANKKDLRFFLF